MSNPQFDALKPQIDADPRVAQLASTRPTGMVTAKELQQLGYPVEHDWYYHAPNNAYRNSKSFHNSAHGLSDPSNWMSRAVGIAGPAMLGLGAGLAASGPAAASGSASAAPSVNGVTTAMPGAITSQGASAGLGGVLPAAGAGGAGATTAAAGGVMGQLKDLFTSPSSAMDLAGMVTALLGASRGGGQADPSAQRLTQMTEDKMRRVDPLHQAVTQLAWGRLPTSARQGIAPPEYKPLS